MKDLRSHRYIAFQLPSFRKPILSGSRRFVRFAHARFARGAEECLRPYTLICAVAVTLLVSLSWAAQGQSQPADTKSQPNQTQAETTPDMVTIPAGTQLPLVLTHPIQSRYLHRGDDIYAQVTAPVSSGSEVAIPPGDVRSGQTRQTGTKRRTWRVPSAIHGNHVPRRLRRDNLWADHV